MIKRSIAVVVVVLSCLSSSGQEPKLTGTATKVDARATVEALASRNPAPKHVGDRHTPIFDPKFDWKEDARAWDALRFAVDHAEEVWPELVSHLDDKRYCVTYKAFSGYTYDFTVGTACREIILRNLARGYFDAVGTRSKVPYLTLDTPQFLREPGKLKPWCERRGHKKLYELQIEICEWTAAELTKPDYLAGESKRDKAGWIATIGRSADSLRDSKKAILWTGLTGESALPYSSKSVAAKGTDGADPFK